MAAINEGASGPQVVAIQTVVGVRPDGYYDRSTKAAVKAWQASHGLPSTGIVDDQTLATMFPPPVAEQPVTVKPIVEQPTPKLLENGSEENQAVTPEVDRILSGGSNKNTNRSSSYSR